MEDEFVNPVFDEEEEEPKDRKIWIIVAVVLIVVCCCCAVIALGGNWLWNNGDVWIDTFTNATEVFSQI